MTKQITLNYNEHCAVLAALELVEAKYENRKKYIYAGLEVEDGELCPVVPQREIREDCIPCTAYDGEIEEYQCKSINDENVTREDN